MDSHYSNDDNYIEWRIHSQLDYDEYIQNDFSSPDNRDLFYCYNSFESVIMLFHEVLREGNFLIFDHELPKAKSDHRLPEYRDFDQWRIALEKYFRDDLSIHGLQLDLDADVTEEGKYAFAYLELFNYNIFHSNKWEYPFPLLEFITAKVPERPVVFQIILYRLYNSKDINIFLDEFLPLLIEKLDNMGAQWIWLHNDGKITKSLK